MNGQGVKIAVIDIGFVGAQAAMDSGDLPPNTLAKSFSGQSDGSSHGTAVAELVHDMAPAAQLYLLCIDSELSLQVALDYVINQGIPIISHSITWLAGRTRRRRPQPHRRRQSRHHRQERLRPWDFVGQRCRELRLEPLDAVPTAYRPGSVFQDFGGGDEGNTFAIPGKTTGCAALTWDAWPQTDQDFNLYLQQTGTGKMLAFSKNIQRPGQLAPPVKQACYGNTGAAPMSVYITIEALPAGGDEPLRSLRVTTRRTGAPQYSPW